MKTDLRKEKSVKKIKEAFISLHKRVGYDGLTVSSLCREAGISRGTFYAHYGNVIDVLDDILDGILTGTDKFWAKYLNTEKEAENKCRKPFCSFVRESKKYQKLLTDDAFSSRIVDKLIHRALDDNHEYVCRNSGLNKDQLKAVLCFQISGCLSITKMGIRDNVKKWSCVRECVDKFVRNGIDGIMQS